MAGSALSGASASGSGKTGAGSNGSVLPRPGSSFLAKAGSSATVKPGSSLKTASTRGGAAGGLGVRLSSVSLSIMEKQREALFPAICGSYFCVSFDRIRRKTLGDIFSNGLWFFQTGRRLPWC